MTAMTMGMMNLNEKDLAFITSVNKMALFSHPSHKITKDDKLEKKTSEKTNTL
ncbi:hypothetical protein [Butyrivibrio sp. MC2021]|uniref:hypothetical protein n=1 Tax=Butyrivibrio sp. MC2021 TaxID=1408306 RepID=UPI000B29EAA4|nr:hypothetical protein [Butyrivibrio sp. MC2021]